MKLPTVQKQPAMEKTEKTKQEEIEEPIVGLSDLTKKLLMTSKNSLNQGKIWYGSKNTR